MADVTLHDGKEITFDLYTFTLKDYTEAFEEEKLLNALIERAAGMQSGELEALPFPDNRKVTATFFSKCKDVTKDPNSGSAST